MLTSMDGFNYAAADGLKQGKAVLKPSCILNYNEAMGGVDHCVQLLSSVKSLRRTRIWYRKVFVHILDMCLCCVL